MSFKTSYIIPEKILKNLVIKKKTARKTSTTKKPRKKKPQPAIQRQPPAPSPPTPLAAGSSAFAQSVRFRASNKYNARPGTRQSKITDYFLPSVSTQLIESLPSEVRHNARLFIGFINESVPQIKWGRDFKVNINDTPVPESNIRDIVLYLYGVGENWLTSYQLEELPPLHKNVIAKNIRLPPKGSLEFYFTLKK